MTHQYTLLVGGTILPGSGGPACSAMAWAEGTVLALGTDAEIRGLSRGDSEVIDAHGGYVVPLGAEDTVTWPPSATLEVGGPADLAIVRHDPRTAGPDAGGVTVIRGGDVQPEHGS